MSPPLIKSRRVLIAAALFAVACITLFLLRPSQPSYEGRTLKDWLRDFPLVMDAAGNQMLPLSSEQQRSVDRAGRAIQMMGDSAHRVLDSELQARDSRLDFELFRVFNRWHRYLRYEYDYTPAYVRRCRAISAVAELGSESTMFVPILKRMCEEATENQIVRHQARAALRKVAPDLVTTGKNENEH